MANSTGDAGGSKASRSAPIGIAGGHSFRQFGQDAAVVREGRWRVPRLAPNFSTGQGRRRREHCQRRSRSPSLPGGFGGPV